MLTYNYVKFRNFGTYGNQWTKIPLKNQGVVWMTGKNHDTGGSNGSGKSFSVDSIRYIQFEETSSGLKDCVGKNYVGILNITKDGKTYEIWQYINHDKDTLIYSYNKVKTEVPLGGKGYKIFCDGRDISPDRVQDCKKEIQRIFNLSKFEYSGYIHLDPNNAPVLIQGRGVERREYLEKFFGLSDFKSLQSMVGDKYDSLKVIVDELQEHETELNLLVSDLKENRDIETLTLLVKDASNKLTILLKNKEQLQDKLDKLKKITEEQDKKKRITTQLAKLPEYTKEEFSATAREIEELELAKTELDKLKVKRDTLVSLQEEIEEKATRLEGVNTKTLNTDYEDLKAKANSFSTLIEESKRFLDKLKDMDHPICPTCSQEINQKNVKLSIEQTREKINTYAPKKESLVKKYSELKPLISVFSEYKSLREQMTKKQDEYGLDIQEADKKLKKLVTIKESLKTLKAKKESLAESKNLKEQLKSYTQDDSDYAENIKELVQKIKDLTIDLDVVKAEKIENEILIKSYNKAVEKIETLEKKLVDYPRLSRKLKLYDALWTAYGDKGLKLRQISRISKNLVRLLPQYTSIMFQEKGIEFIINSDKDDCFDIFVHRKAKNVKYDIKSLSSGEKKRFSPALMVSQADMTPANKKTNLLILDELDANLDKIGKVAFAEKLIPILKQKYETIIVIAHSDDMDSLNYDKRWLIEKKNDMSVFNSQSVK